MPVSSYIHGVGGGSGDTAAHGNGVRVSDAGSLLTTNLPLRRKDIYSLACPGPNQRPLSSRLLTTAGSSAMNVNGSATNVSFRFSAAPTAYRVVTDIITYIEDSQMNAGSNEVRRFGSAAAAPGLTVGLYYRFYYGGVFVNLIPGNVQNISNYVVYSNSVINIVDGVSAGVDIFVAKLTLSAPVELVPEKMDYIEVMVRDNLSTLTTMYAVALGFSEGA